MLKVLRPFLFCLLMLKIAAADSENGSENVSSETSFPSISSISSNDGSFSIPQPSLDLAPTNLAENSPMSFSIPSLELNLEETDFAKNAPMIMSITQPDFDLDPTFTFGQDLEEPRQPKEIALEAKTSSDNKLPLEQQIYPKEGEKAEKRRRRRQAPGFPSIFSFRSSNDPFSIAFPTPDLTPGTFFKFQDPLSNEIPNTSHDKRQVSFFNFRPSKLLSESNLRPSNTIRPVKRKPIRPTRFKPTPHQTRKPLKFKSSKFASLDPVLLLPQSEEAARPVRQNRFRPPPRYPPFDPFNTTYIPLPGPSSPSYALPLTGGNPHRVKGAETALFRRPIRQSFHSPVLPSTRDLRSQFSGTDPENEVFGYESSKQFEASELGRFFRSKHKSVPK